jgi:hypothetical protein
MELPSSGHSLICGSGTLVILVALKHASTCKYRVFVIEDAFAKVDFQKAVSLT